MIEKSVLETFGPVVEHEPLKYHTTYRIGGRADYMIEPNDTHSLESLIAYLNENGEPWMVLGNGSNVLVADEPYHGVVISLKDSFGSFVFHDCVLDAEAGCSIISMAFEAKKRALSGLEFASGIPGTIGGGLYMNAGAYLHDLAEIVLNVTVLTDKGIEVFEKDQLDFTYRHSLFQKHPDWIILSARFALTPGDPDQISRLMNSRKQRRLNSQPVSRPCAGSVFRNPQGQHAWQIIDKLGYRGKSIGGAKVSDIHSNFIINESGNANAKDVDALIRAIQRDARKTFGVELITEVERINWHEEREEKETN